MFSKILIISLVIIYSQISFAKKLEVNFPMLSPQTYANLPKNLQKEYLEKTRKIWMEFEKKYPLKASKSAKFWEGLFIETAHAANNVCIIGGSVLNTVNNSCPTKLKHCQEKADGFRCGMVFGETCVDRTPISTISERCYKEGNKKIFNKEEYIKAIHTIALDFEALCTPRSPSNTHDGCKYLAKRMTDVTKELEFKVAALDKYNANPIVESRPTVETAVAEEAADATPEISSNADQARERRAAASTNVGSCSYNNRGAIVPTFDLLSENTCVFDNNQKLLESLASNGCSIKGAMRRLTPTKIKSVGNYRVDGQANNINVYITKAELLERKSDNEATFNVQMVKYDLAKDPPQLQQITKKIKQVGDKYYWLGMWGVSREVTMHNTTRSFELANMEGYKTMIHANVRLTDDCLLLEDINTLQANGTRIAPAVNSGGGSAAGSM